MKTNSVNTLFLGHKHEWYKNIYTLLSAVRDNFDLKPLSECSIVLSKSNKLLKAREVKFIDDSSVILDKRFEEVSKDTYEEYNSAKSKARLFLESIGVNVFSKNDAQVIKNERKRYYCYYKTYYRLY